MREVCAASNLVISVYEEWWKPEIIEEWVVRMKALRVTTETLSGSTIPCSVPLLRNSKYFGQSPERALSEMFWFWYWDLQFAYWPWMETREITWQASRKAIDVGEKNEFPFSGQLWKIAAQLSSERRRIFFRVLRLITINRKFCADDNCLQVKECELTTIGDSVCNENTSAMFHHNFVFFFCKCRTELDSPCSENQFNLKITNT